MTAIDIVGWVAVAAALASTVLIGARFKRTGNGLLVAALVALFVVAFVEDRGAWSAAALGAHTALAAQRFGQELRRGAGAR